VHLAVGAALIIRLDDSSGSGVGSPVEDSEDGVGLGTAFASVNQVQFLEIRGLFSMASIT
jgi:hypothetical protein